MANLLGRIVKSWSEPPFWATEDKSWVSWIPSSKPNEEMIESDFEGYVQGLYKSDGIVFACIRARQAVFSEARFQWRDFTDGRPGDWAGTAGLEILENPWPGGTTRELMSRMESVASLAGNYYATTADDRGHLGRAATTPRRVVHMRPDWVKIVISSATGNPYALDSRILGYLYEARSPDGRRLDPVLLMPDEVCHYSPIPDPIARFRGMSWLTPVLREVMSDKAATKHKLKFFENNATMQTMVSLKETVTPTQFKDFVKEFKAAHEGVDNAYKTLFVGGGADVTPISVDLKNLDFKGVQGGGETRIAAAAGAHPVVVGLSEGLAGSSLNAGNYAAARRSFVDGTIRHLWGTAAASLQPLVIPPKGARLWPDDRDVGFLREDAMDAAEILSRQMLTIESGVRAGFEPKSVRDAVNSLDLSRLEHTGLYSVQLQPPGTTQPPATDPPEEDQA